ncbi:MAG: response regulator [Planctomycetota bacterium]|nr:MAG: response regulator [Planctomycetota bacterium]
MIEKLLRLIPRRSWLWLGAAAVLASFIPWYYEFTPVAVLAILPVMTFAICVLFAPRKALTLWTWAAGSTVLVLLVREQLPQQQTMVLASVLAAQTAIASVTMALALAPWSIYRRQWRLARRLRRQTTQLVDAQRRSESSEQAVRRLETDRQALLEHLPIHVVQKDRQGRFTFVSQSFCKLVGRSYEEILGKTDFDLFPAEAARKFVEDDRRVMAAGAVFTDVEQTQLPDGSTGFMQVRKAPLRDERGEVVGVHGIFWDVTEEHLRQRELQRIESLAHALIHAALDAVLIVDADGHVLEANPAAERILGYAGIEKDHPPLGSIIHTSLEQSGGRASDPPGGPLVHRQAPIAEILKAATGTRIEAKLRRRDQTWFDAEISTHPLDVDGSQGWAIFIRDITRRKRAQTELVAAKESAERANAAKSEFVANVSHELRTPLTAVLGLHELLAKSPLTARQREYLELAQLSASNLLMLIDDLLDFSKIESGKLDIDPAPFALRECVEDAVRAISARAQYKGLEVVIDFAHDIPVQVEGDAHRIRQIILNLVGNALKFTEKGEIRIAVRRSPADSQPEVGQLAPIRIEVHDTGMGIPPEKRQVIFEAFRQADSSTTRRFGGTGLGLTICRDLVAAMGGTIGVTDARTPNDEPQSGSCFFFEIPLRVLRTFDAAVSTRTGEQQFVIAANPSTWSRLLLRDMQHLGFPCMHITIQDLFQRQPAELFAAGNNTVVLADYRELLAAASESAPVVRRWIMLTEIYSESTHHLPPWLGYASIRWLSRPVKQAELLEALRDHDAAQPAPGKGQKAARSADAPPDQTKVKRTADVLLVEDSPISQTVLRDMLQGEGHRVDTAGDGRSAIQKCRQRKYDLVLMDIQMPEIDGLEATRQIRAAEAQGAPRQTIVALTAHASPTDRQKAQQAGMDGFLIKPIALQALQTAIDKVLSGQPLDFAADNASVPAMPHAASTAARPAERTVADAASQNHRDDLTLKSPPTFEQLVEQMHGNEELVRDVLQLLSHEAPKLGRQFHQAVEQKQWADAQRAAHTLKSNARHVALHDVAQLAEQLETAARNNERETLEAQAAGFLKIAEQVGRWARTALKHSRQ